MIRQKAIAIIVLAAVCFGILSISVFAAPVSSFDIESSVQNDYISEPVRATNPANTSPVSGAVINQYVCSSASDVETHGNLVALTSSGSIYMAASVSGVRVHCGGISYWYMAAPSACTVYWSINGTFSSTSISQVFTTSVGSCYVAYRNHVPATTSVIPFYQFDNIDRNEYVAASSFIIGDNYSSNYIFPSLSDNKSLSFNRSSSVPAVSYVENNTSPVYYFGMGNRSVVCSLTSGAVCHFGNGTYTIGYDVFTYDGNTYYWASADSLIFCNWFNTKDLATAFSELMTAVASDPGPDPGPDPDPDPDPDPVPVIPGFGNTFTFSLPAGYAALIYGRGVDTSITLNTIFREKSALVPSSVGSNGQWWWGNSQSWCFSDWVVVGDVFYTGDIFDSSLINWVRKNQMFGTRQSINGSYTLSWDSSEHEGVVIVNPYFNYYDSMYNNDISITVPVPLSIWVYKLDSFYDNSGSSPLVKSSVTSRYILGGDGQYYSMDSNGDPVAGSNTVVLPSGGDNAAADAQTSVLDNIVSSIEQFFVGTWGHIRTLTDSLGAFPSMMKQIFSFLPSDFTSIILAFFGILVALGVVKALL